MSRDDWEVGGRLSTPHIEIGKRFKSINDCAAVNVSTFEECLGHIFPSATDKGPTDSKEKDYVVYGVVGRIVPTMGRAYGYLNIAEETVSRTLMGFLPANVLKEKLPKVYEQLNPEKD